VTADRRVPSQKTQNAVVQLIECTTIHRASLQAPRKEGGSMFKTQPTNQNSKWLWYKSLSVTALGFHKQVVGMSALGFSTASWGYCEN